MVLNKKKELAARDIRKMMVERYTNNLFKLNLFKHNRSEINTVKSFFSWNAIGCIG